MFHSTRLTAQAALHIERHNSANSIVSVAS